MTKNYLVVYAKSKGSNFSGFAPDVPGCVSAGDSLSEMQKMMRDALEAHLQILLEDGEAPPLAVTTRVDFNPEDFIDVEYFVVQVLSVNIPEYRASHAETNAA